MFISVIVLNTFLSLGIHNRKFFEIQNTLAIRDEHFRKQLQSKSYSTTLNLTRLNNTSRAIYLFRHGKTFVTIVRLYAGFSLLEKTHISLACISILNDQFVNLGPCGNSTSAGFTDTYEFVR